MAIAAGRHTSSWPWPLRLVRAVIVVLSARRRGRPAGQPPIWHCRRQSTIYGNVVAAVVVAVVVARCTRCGGGGWPTAAFSSLDVPGGRSRPGLSVGENVSEITKTRHAVNMRCCLPAGQMRITTTKLIYLFNSTADDFSRDMSAEPGSRIHTYATYLYVVQSATRAPCALRTMESERGRRQGYERARKRPRAPERPKERRRRGAATVDVE